MSIARFSVKNPVLVNLLMIGLFIYGTFSLFKMPTELNPKLDFNWVFVTTTYPGASPSEVENLIIDPMESEIQDVDNIDAIQSTSGESYGMLLVKFEDMSATQFRERFTDLKAEIDKVSLPDGAEDPIIDDFGSDDFVPVINVNMQFTIPEENAQYIAEELEEDLKDINGVAKIQVSGFADREIWIECDPAKMNSLGVTFEEIVMALKFRNINVPGGNISFGKKEYLIRSLGEYQTLSEIENTIIPAKSNFGSGQVVKIKDVADVNDTREEMTILSRINGEPAITFSISKKADANSIELINNVKELVKEYKASVPDGVTFGWTQDNSVYINRIVGVLRNNAILGMVLIIVLLYIFLGGRNSFLASLGIPISFFITFIFMDAVGFSLNGSTLFALVMVLGIIVDDAIIVIENCHRHRLLGLNSFQAAEKGTMEVAGPILTSILTNIAAFLPLMLLPGIMGKFMRIIPIVFTLALLASLFEAFFLLPSHYADWTVKSKTYKKGEKKFFRLLRKHYGHFLIKVIRKRYLVLGIMSVVLILSLSLIGVIGVEMFGEEDFDQFSVLVKFPEGTSLEETDRIMKKFEKAALELDPNEVQDVVVNIGLLQGNEEWIEKKSVAQVLFQLYPKEQRSKSIDDLLVEMREDIKNISGPTAVELQKISGGPPVGKPISIKVQGKYLEDIKAAAVALQDSIKTIAGTKEITDDFPPGKEEIRIRVDEDRVQMYGFSIQQVAMNVRYAFDGITATEYRDGDDEIDTIVKYSKDYRSSVDDVLNLKMVNPMGQTIALRDMVSFEIVPGPTEIKRFDQKRTIMVLGDIDKNVTSLDKVNNAIKQYFPNLEKEHPGITFEFGGEFEEFTDTFADIGQLFIVAMILIFLILGTQFNSYSQPLIILSTVPFALIGAMLGLLISGNPFSIVALFGFVALAGIVVNDAIVLIDFVNKRRKGKETTVFQYWRSIINAGRLRLRPIILTSLTTISGLVPMAFGFGGKSLMWSPLANVILYGLLVATVLTLFVIPCLIAILDDIQKKRKQAMEFGY